MIPRLLSLTIVLGAGEARGAAAPTVAVMPFKDLSGGKSAVGEAIRETVTADLRDAGLRVIERASLDKVLAEQNLQASRADLDLGSAVRVGKLLGASLMVAGAYQRSGATVRLTARFVRVETGEIVGTAKVDGPAGDLLALQDKVTADLVRSAGLEPKAAAVAVATVGRRKRPRLRSLEPLELYGQAVVEPDEGKRRDKLKAAVAAEPQLTYAVRDLEALEKRMAAYGAAAEREQERANRELKERLGAEKDPTKIAQQQLQLFANLMIQRRWKRLCAEARAVLAHPPPPAPGYPVDVAEHAHINLIRCHEQLKEDDALLREGEKFLAKYPASMMFSIVRLLMDAAIERKRKRDEGAADAVAEMAKLNPAERADPCRVSVVYQFASQYRDARRELEVCLKKGGFQHTPGLAEFRWVFLAWELGDYDEVVRMLGVLKAKYPEQYRNARHLEGMVPVSD